MTVYKSAKGVGILFLVALILVLTSVFMILDNAWPGIFINVAVMLFIIYLFYSITYTIDGNKLLIKSGFLYRKEISINKITKISETNNPLSSPAASLDRLAVYFNKRDMVMISPAKKYEFIKHMQELNPQIVVVLKKKKTGI